MGVESWVELSQSNPHELSNEELNRFMQMAWERTAGNMQSGNVYAALMSVKESRLNKRAVRLSLLLSTIAVIFSLVSVIFTSLNWSEDKSWQDAQIKELQKQSNYLMQLVNIQHQTPNKVIKTKTPKNGAH